MTLNENPTILEFQVDDEDRLPSLEEPVFKYDRVEGDVANAFEKDVASSIASSDSIVAIGMHSGVIYIYNQAFTLLKRQRPHGATIFDLKLDSESQYVAGASMDGKVSVLSIFTDDSYIQDLRRPVRSVALEPGFSRKTAHQIISGGLAGNLVLHERGWLGPKERTLHAGDGPIWSIEWNGRLVAWASDAGIRVIDVSTHNRIAYLPRSVEEPRPELFRCNMDWCRDSRLHIGWAGTIKTLTFYAREGGYTSAEITDILQVDCMISGVAVSGGEMLVLGVPLEVEDASEEGDTSLLPAAVGRPELRTVTSQGEELSADALDIKNFGRFKCDDYRLSRHQSGFLILSPNGVISARPRTTAERVSWFVENRRYREALELGQSSGVISKSALADIGRSYLLDLTSQGRYAVAAEKAPSLLGEDAKLWEDWIFFLAEKGHLQHLALQIPTSQPRLSHLAYEVVLLHLLQVDSQMMINALSSWPTEIYDLPALIAAAEDFASRNQSSAALHHCLAELYLRAHQPGKAVAYLLSLQDRRVFEVIRTFNLFTDVRDRALQLMRLDDSVAITDSPQQAWSMSASRLLVEHIYSIPVPRVVEQLRDHEIYLFRYLDALFDHDSTFTADYADLLISLYAKFAPGRLIQFMRASTTFSLEKAYQICSSRDFIYEMVFLQTKMGNNKRALHLIIDRLGSAKEAIAFTKEQNDVDLWEELLVYSESRPQFIEALLDNAGSEVDPVRLVRRIRNGVHIAGLKRAVIGILQDVNLQLALVGGCHTIVLQENHEASSRLHRSLTRGTLVMGHDVCTVCLKQFSSRLCVIFPCSHTIHLSCLKDVDDFASKADARAKLRRVQLACLVMNCSGRDRLTSKRGRWRMKTRKPYHRTGNTNHLQLREKRQSVRSRPSCQCERRLRPAGKHIVHEMVDGVVGTAVTQPELTERSSYKMGLTQAFAGKQHCCDS